MSIVFDSGSFEAALSSARYGRSFRRLEQTQSTMDDARADAEAGAADGHVVLAETQLGGRGSRGRTWSSPPGDDLYLSIVARPPLAMTDLPPLTLAVGLGVADAVASCCPTLEPQIKWPNDVWIGTAKLAGVLVETKSTGTSDAAIPAVIIGIGINVNRRAFPNELEASSTSLALSVGAPVQREHVLAALLGAVEARVDAFVREGPERSALAIQERLLYRNEMIRCDSTVGTLVGVAPSGALRVRMAAGLVDLVAGRVERA